MSSYKPPPAGAHTFKPPRIIVRVNNEIQRRPFLAKTFACAAGFAFVVAAPVQFAGLQWMDKNIMPNESHSKRAAIIKFTLDNVIGCTLWQAVMISIDQEYRRGQQSFLAWDHKDRAHQCAMARGIVIVVVQVRYTPEARDLNKWGTSLIFAARLQRGEQYWRNFWHSYVDSRLVLQDGVFRGF